MNQAQAEKFIQKIMQIWEKGQIHLLEEMYDPQVTAHYQHNHFGFNAIKNRMEYINIRYPKRKFYVNETILINPHLILFRVRQTSVDKLYKKPTSIDVTGVYRIENNIIKEVWLMSDIPMDYYATCTPNKLTKEKNTIDEVERTLFNKKLLDYNYFYQGQKVELTAREKDCLYYFLNGYTAKEIARMLNLTHRTVEDYLAKIKEKYGCSSKQELRQKIFPSGPLL